MTREEAIRQLQSLRDHCRTMIRDEYEDGIWALDIAALDFALTALRPVSRELVEKAWRGHWVKCKHADYYVCNKCSTVSKAGEDEFCKSCGAPMTDEAVDMMLEKLEAMYEAAE